MNIQVLSSLGEEIWWKENPVENVYKGYLKFLFKVNLAVIVLDARM